MHSLVASRLAPGWGLPPLVVLLAWWPAPMALAQVGAPGCRLDIQIEGLAAAEALVERLRADARSQGACSRPWTLRVTPGPKGQFIVGLWNGSDLENRWAKGAAEVPAVAGLLLRVAVEHAGAQEASRPASPADSIEPPAARSLDPAPPPSSPGFELSVQAGPSWSDRAGTGVEAALLGTFGGRTLRVGLGPRIGSVAREGRGRTEVALPVVGEARFPVGERLSAGMFAEIGIDAQRAQGTALDMTTSESATGLALGAGPFLRLRLGEAWWLGFLLPFRYATTQASARTGSSTTTTMHPGPPPGNPGKGNPKPPVVTTTTEPDAASADAAGRLGGLSVSPSLSLGCAL